MRMPLIVWVSEGVALIKSVISLPCSQSLGLRATGDTLAGRGSGSKWLRTRQSLDQENYIGIAELELEIISPAEIQASLPPLQVTELVKREAGFEPRAQVSFQVSILDRFPGWMAGSGPYPSLATVDLLLPSLRSQADTIGHWGPLLTRPLHRVVF